MNTTPTLISPARAVDAKAGASRDNGATETPFSQVLSDEMASQRNASSGRSQADKPAAAEAPARNEPAAQAAAASAESPAADTAPAQAAEASASADTAASDSLDPTLQTAVTDPAALLGLAAAPTAASALTRPVGSEATLDSTPAKDAAHGLVQPPDAGSRQGRPLQQRADAQAGVAALRADAGAAGKATAQPAVATESAVQLAAASQPETGSVATESGFDQILHPALRAAAPLHEVAARLGAEAAQPRLAPPVGSNAWGQALGDKIVWMTSAAQQTATLTLNPPNLGPLQVVLNVSNDQAVANFFAAQPEVRQALESAFPRLKEMLNEAGIQLEQATVSADTSPQQQEASSGRPGQRGPDLKDVPAAHAGESLVPLPAQRAGRGLIDTFA